jgi:chemotaxis methyl-accepting protein methylase
MSCLQPPFQESRTHSASVDAVLALLLERTGLDFSRYRRASVERRIANRMLCARVSSLPEYLTLLESTPEEPARLIERLTIKVSRFYRDPVTFDALRGLVLPALQRARGEIPLRIWCAGCGYGEEAWTLAMLLADAGIPGQVLATDVDELALQRARIGSYSADACGDLPEVCTRFLAPGDHRSGRVAVADALRARVRFARHDVTAEAPPEGGGFDLVSCRNVLIYFQRDAQETAARTLAGGLAGDGYLCLGEAEWPPAGIAVQFEPLPGRTKLFRRCSGQGATR